MSYQKSVVKECEVCNSSFKTYVAWLRDGKAGRFCSRKCQTIGRIKRPKTVLSYTCKECSKIFTTRKSRGGTYEFCSIKCLTVNRGRNMRGANHPNWKGGITERGAKSKQWARMVKKRDNNMCIECASQLKVEAHHIKSWAEHKTLRYDITNGMTLCIPCHANKHENIKNFILHKMET